MNTHHSFDTMAIIRRTVATVSASAALFALCACGAQTASTSTDTKKTDSSKTADVKPLQVVASVNQWGTLAKEIGGDHVEVTSIINNADVDPHDYEPTSADIAKLTSTQVAVLNGAGYDEWASKALESKKSTPVVDAADLIGAHEGDNPHLWFSADARKAVAESLKKTYTQLLPAAKDYFDKQYNTWLKSETELDKKMADFKSSHEGKSYAATESVAHYLMTDLGLTDKTPEGYANASANETEPKSTDINEFKALLEKKKVDLLVNNPQESSDLTAQLTHVAGSAKIPFVDITEQVPSDFTTLNAWITNLVEKISKDMK